jgi:hypothetical protein
LNSKRTLTTSRAMNARGSRSTPDWASLSERSWLRRLRAMAETRGAHEERKVRRLSISFGAPQNRSLVFHGIPGLTRRGSAGILRLARPVSVLHGSQDDRTAAASIAAVPRWFDVRAACD